MLVIIATAPAASAAAMALPGWSEEAAIQEFRAVSPEIAAARRAIELARAEVTAVGVWPNPTLGVEREQVFTAGGPTEQNRVEVQVPLPVIGLRAARLAIAEAGLAVAEARARESEWSLVLNFKESYATAVSAESGVKARAHLDDTYGRLVRIVGTRRRVGESAGIDLARLQLARAGLVASLAVARLEAGRAHARLAGLVGRPMNGVLCPAPLLRPPAVEMLLGRARRVRADLAGMAAERLVAVLEGELSERRRWPEPQAAIGLLQTHEPTVQGVGYSAGVAWPVPFFDRALGTAARANAAMGLADARWTAATTRLLAELPAAHAAYVSRLAVREAYQREALSHLDPIATAAETSYREGASGIDALLASVAAIAEARLQAIALDEGARAARRDLERVLGEPLESPDGKLP